MNKPLVQWYQKFEVGVPQIDAEHRTLLEKINVYWQRLEEGAALPALLEALGDIASFTEFHFHSEEALMARHAYPDQEKHAEIHRYLLAQLPLKVAELSSSPLYDIEAIKLYSYLIDWFVHHTTQEDHKLGDYLRHRVA